MTTHSGFAIVDDTLGTFVRGHHILSDGVRLDDNYFSLTRNIDGRAVGFIAHSSTPTPYAACSPACTTSSISSNPSII